MITSDPAGPITTSGSGTPPRRRRRAYLTLAAGCSVLAITACGPAPTVPDTTVTFSRTVTGAVRAWAFDNADDVGTARLEFANAQLASSRVSVAVDTSPFDPNKFNVLADGDNVPDVVQMDRNFVTTYAAQGLIQPLDDCYTANGVDAAERYYPSVVDDVTYNNTIWAVPQFYQPPAIILNSRVLAAAGVTPDQIDIARPADFLDAVTAMTVLDNGVPTRLGFDAKPTEQAAIWMLAFGGQIIDEDGRPTLDDPRNADAVDFLSQLMEAQGGWVNVKNFTASLDPFGADNQFVTDRVGAEIDAQWFVNVLAPYAGAVEISAVPIRDTTGNPFAVAGGTAFVIPTNAANPSAACQWMLSLTSDEAWHTAGAARAATVASTPGSLNSGIFTGSPLADQALRESYVTGTGHVGFDEAITTFYDVVANGKSYGSSPAGQQIQGALADAVDRALLGEATSTEALADAQAAALDAYSETVGD